MSKNIVWFVDIEKLTETISLHMPVLSTAFSFVNSRVEAGMDCREEACQDDWEWIVIVKVMVAQ